MNDEKLKKIKTALIIISAVVTALIAVLDKMQQSPETDTTNS